MTVPKPFPIHTLLRRLGNRETRLNEFLDRYLWWQAKRELTKKQDLEKCAKKSSSRRKSRKAKRPAVNA